MGTSPDTGGSRFWVPEAGNWKYADGAYHCFARLELGDLDLYLTTLQESVVANEMYRRGLGRGRRMCIG